MISPTVLRTSEKNRKWKTITSISAISIIKFKDHIAKYFEQLTEGQKHPHFENSGYEKSGYEKP